MPISSSNFDLPTPGAPITWSPVALTSGVKRNGAAEPWTRPISIDLGFIVFLELLLQLIEHRLFAEVLITSLAVACGGVGSAVVIVGAGMGGAKIGLTSAPYNMSVSTSLWGRRKELLELVAMAQRGQVNIRTTTYAIEDGEQAYEDMHAGTIVGRAVVVP